MEVIVDQDLCISCGTCIDLCPKIFEWNDDGKADVLITPIPEEDEQCCRDALEDCPVEAIQEK